MGFGTTTGPGNLQPLPIPYSPAFHPKHLIDNPEGKRILTPAAFECG
jgi:hypothetical protein